jgi:hypothetical protein
LIEAFGERKSCPDWTRDPRCRIGLIGLYGRLASGWPPEEALTAPSRSKPSRRIDPVIVPETRPTPHRVDWPAAVALYEKEQLSEDEIARRFGVTQGAVIRGLRLRGVKRRMPVVTAADRERQRLRRTWLSVHERCDNPHDIQYPYMGARGIRVSPAWRDFKPFHAWALAMGARPGVWLVRKDSRGHWSPENCEWVRPEVARHRERPHGMPPPKRYVTAFGETKGVSEWSKDPRCTVRDFTISRRLDKGWRPEDAISGPPTNPGTTGLRLVVLRAFGEEKSKREWLCDPRCGGIGHVALDLRLRQGWSAQDAISTPPWRHPAQASAAAR